MTKSPDQLLAETKAEIKQGVLIEERSIFADVPRFRQFLKSKNLAPNTIRNYIMAAQSFYSYYNIQFPKQRKLESTVLESNIEIPTKSDIQTILKVCDPLEKAIVLVGVSSGLSMNEIINLKVGNFKDGYDPTTGITTLKLLKGKTKVDFITFLTPDTSQAVIDYLEFRNYKNLKNNFNLRMIRNKNRKPEIGSENCAAGRFSCYSSDFSGLFFLLLFL